MTTDFSIWNVHHSQRRPLHILVRTILNFDMVTVTVNKHWVSKFEWVKFYWLLFGMLDRRIEIVNSHLFTTEILSYAWSPESWNPPTMRNNMFWFQNATFRSDDSVPKIVTMVSAVGRTHITYSYIVFAFGQFCWIYFLFLFLYTIHQLFTTFVIYFICMLVCE